MSHLTRLSRRVQLVARGGILTAAQSPSRHPFIASAVAEKASRTALRRVGATFNSMGALSMRSVR